MMWKDFGFRISKKLIIINPSFNTSSSIFIDKTRVYKNKPVKKTTNADTANDQKKEEG